MKLLVFSYVVVLVIHCASMCNAKSENNSNQLSPSTPAVEHGAKTVRSTSTSTAAQNAGGHVPAIQNSLASSQDGPPKQASSVHNNQNPNVIHPNSPSTNGLPPYRPLPPIHSHHQLQQYVRAFTALPKPQDYNNNHPLTPVKTHEIPPSHLYTHFPNGGPPIGINTPPGVTSASGGYILSMNTENGQTLTASGPTPVIMQYIPQSQPSAGIQYLQLIPTRPLIVPISPFLSPLSPSPHQSHAQPPPQLHQQQQHQPSHHPHPLYHHQPPLLHQLPSQYLNVRPAAAVGPLTQSSPPYTNYAAGQSYLSAGQLYHQHHPVYQSSNGGGGYAAAASSSAPVVSYFRPHTGIQLVNGPVDMSLNTNEYIPIQNNNNNDSGYKIRRP